VLLKPFTHRVDGVQVSALTMVGGATILLAVSSPSIGAADWAAAPASAWGAIVYSGLAGLVVAYLFWYRGVRVLGPTRTAMYVNLQPVFALVVAWAALVLLHEYLRARAAVAGMPDIGAVTVGERPTRVSVAISGLLVGGVAGLVQPGWDTVVTTVAAAAWLGLSVVGLVQLAAVVRRTLRDL
jgi:drug/metabolite transporter (DMT)-like permease